MFSFQVIINYSILNYKDGNLSDRSKKRKYGCSIISLKAKAFKLFKIISWRMFQNKKTVSSDQLFCNNNFWQFINSSERIRWTCENKIKLLIAQCEKIKNIHF